MMTYVGRKLFRRTAAAILAGLLALPAGATALAQGSIDPDASKILKAMSDYLGGLQAFSADVGIDEDVITEQGQKLKLVSSGALLAERPGSLHITRKGAIVDIDLVLGDGTLTIYGKGLNAYMQMPAATIDEAINVVRDDIGYDAPGADLLSAMPFAPEVTDIVGGTHVGMTSLGGKTVHHLAFRGTQVDWQVWVQDGDEPLPLLYVITSKWVAGAPEYTLQFSNWNTAPSVADTAFAFTPPAGAEKVGSISIDPTGQQLNSREQ